MYVIDLFISVKREYDRKLDDEHKIRGLKE